MDDIAQVFARLDATCRADDFCGWDPFDGLNSRLLRRTGLHRSRLARLAWLQAFKRSPLNLRPLTGVPKTANAKAESLFLRSTLLRGEMQQAAHHRQRLLALRADVPRWGGACWGYPFDWQARAFFVPEGTPNVICTAYALLALRMADGAGADETARAAAGFVQRHLAVTTPHGRHIAYIPGSAVLVYNASLWGAYVCLEGWQAGGGETLKDLAEAAIAGALGAQRADGAWVYGTQPHHGFIDGFHTGYNLEALHRMNRILQRADIAEAIARGLDFYLAQCFEPDGLARYYAGGLYPVDPHSAAQGIVTLLTIDAPRYREQAARMARAMIAVMWDERAGRFYYQRRRAYTNRIPYLRWTQAWMHLALAMLLADGVRPVDE